MTFLSGSHFLVLCVLFFTVTSAPVQEPELTSSKRHHLNTDKELLLEKLKDLENELGGRRSSQVPGDDNPLAGAEPRKKESPLEGDSTDKADEDDIDPGKVALHNFLEKEFGKGHFVDQPFSDNKLGQVRGDEQKKEDYDAKKKVSDFDKSDMMAKLDSMSVDDLKKLLSGFEPNKRDYNSGDEDTDGEDANSKTQDGDDDDAGTNDGDDDESDGFLQGISVQELKELIETVKQKKQDGALTPQDLGKVVYYLVTHLTTDDLQTMVDAAKAQEEKEDEVEDVEMTDEEIGEALAGLVRHTSADQLQRLLAALRARKQELEDISEESEESSSEGDLDDRELHQTEEEVMQSLLDFLAGLSPEALQKTILAVQRKKMEMQQAMGDITGEYIQGKDDSNDDGHGNDDDSDEVVSDDLGPCAEEKQDILDKAAASGHYWVGEVPNCDEDGFYALKQCSGSMCYCVDKHGTLTMGEAMVWEAASLVCSQEDVDASSYSSSEEDTSSSDVSEDDEESSSDVDDEDEETKLEQVERDLLEMLKEQKRQQLSKKDLNM